MNKLLDFITTTLAGNADVMKATGGRIYSFETAQGVHIYPIIYWRVITTTAAAKDLASVGDVWQSEVQIDAITHTPEASARLAAIVQDVFNNARKTDGILDSYSDEVLPVYTNEDETISYAVRVFVNHTI